MAKIVLGCYCNTVDFPAIESGYSGDSSVAQSNKKISGMAKNGLDEFQLLEQNRPIMAVAILIVGDETATVNLFKLMISIEKPDWVFHGAYNGQEALAIVAHNHIDLVILDIMMPGMDGIEVCRHLRADPNTAKIPIAMFTALDRPDVHQHALDAGATDFWVKPIPRSKLVSAMDRLLSNHQ